MAGAVSSRRTGPAPDRLYQKVAADLAARIAGGAFAGSPRLPTERSLAAMLSVSRTTIREALLVLELRGVLEIRGGSGIYLRDGALQQRLASQMPGFADSPREALELRRILEVELAGRAARRATPAGLAEIQTAIDRGWRDLEAGRVRHDDLSDDPDGRFHVAIACAARNNTAALLIRELWRVMRSPLTRTAESHVQLEQYAELSMLDHERILHSIREQDPEAARQAMRRHLTRYGRLLGWDAAG